MSIRYNKEGIQQIHSAINFALDYLQSYDWEVENIHISYQKLTYKKELGNVLRRLLDLPLEY